MFTRQEVRDHILADKQVRSVVMNPASKSRAIPKFLRLKSRRIFHSDLMNVGGDYRALMLWRDGVIFEKRMFCAWLFLEKGTDLVPIARMDYHPSHKGFHVHFNCEDERDLTNRALPGAKDLKLGGTRKWDPKWDTDRMNLVGAALKCFNISILGAEKDLL